MAIRTSGYQEVDIRITGIRKVIARSPAPRDDAAISIGHMP